jgi:photosystem II stability/assembly factor-like uncharacterized protein
VPEPRDELDTWLSVQVRPMLPPPGTFERVSGQARRRRIRRAVLSAAGALAVVAVAAVVIPKVAIPAPGAGRQASVAGGSHGAPASPRHPVPEASSSPATTPASRPAAPPPLSVTFVGTATGWVMGQAGTARQCDLPAAPACIVLQRTDTADTGRAGWRTAGAPPTHGPSGPSGVSQVRFLNLSDGWAFGPELWATHDGGQSWARIGTGGLRVTALEARGDRVFAVWARCTGTGPGFASRCTRFSVYSSGADGDTWAPVPGAPAGPGLVRAGGAASLVLTGTTAYLLSPGGILFAGPLTGAPWQPVSGTASPAAAPSCRPGPAQPGGQPSGALLAANASGLVLVCAGPPAGGRQRKTVYASADGGQTWQQTGTAPARGTATSLSGSPSSTLVLATSLGIEVSADGGATWTAAAGARPAGGFAYVGMTTATQGVAVPADPARHAIWFTYDGGGHWQPSAVGA